MEWIAEMCHVLIKECPVPANEDASTVRGAAAKPILMRPDAPPKPREHAASIACRRTDGASPLTLRIRTCGRYGRRARPSTEAHASDSGRDMGVLPTGG